MLGSDTESDFQRSNNIFNAVQDMAQIGGWEVDLLNNSLYWTEQTYRIHDTTPAQYSPTFASAIDFYPPQWVPVITAALESAVNQGTDFNLELELITAKGRKIWVHIYAKVIMSQGQATKILGAFQDISDKKQTELEIWQHSNFDSLTQLPNRRLFLFCLEKELIKAHRAKNKLALLVIGLDHFKEVNETFGHEWGDAVLKQAAQRLTSCVRESDTLARWTGDEFTIIISDLNQTSHVERIVNNILTLLAQPFVIGAEVAYLTASVGISLYPDNATKHDSLRKNANQAMYLAKQQGRNCFRYYTSSMQQAAQARRSIVSHLRGAVLNNEFRLVYQPIVELSSGAIIKAEALIRWHHPTRGLISPVDFIHIAEQTGLIIDIGEWVFQQAAQQVKQWRNLCNNDFQISINTSPVQYHDRDNKLSQWPKDLHSIGLPGNAIVAEITEGVLMDSHREIVDMLLAFRKNNIQISLDDFGTGYSSLSYLKNFPIDYLKIDQSFVRNMMPESKDLALCEGIIAMAHKLNIKVIAEGIETQQQRKLLMAAGCDFGQGYLFSRPVPAADFEKLLSVNKAIPIKIA